MGRHAIHLGSAWETPGDGAADYEAAGCSGPGSVGAGRGPWRRRFHRPTGLVAGDRLLLVWEHGEPGAGRPQGAWLTVNGTDLPPLITDETGQPTGAWEVDVTDLVRDRNELLLHGAAEIGVDRASGTRSSLPHAWGRLSLVVVSD